MRAGWWCLLLAVPVGVLAGEPSLAPSPDEPPPAPRPAPAGPAAKRGIATISHGRLEGHTTASGELYNRGALAAAHRSLPFGTMVRVINVKNQRSVVVRINDRGAGIGNSIIELTPRAASMIGLHGISVGEVRLEIVGTGSRLPPDAVDPVVPPVK